MEILASNRVKSRQKHFTSQQQEQIKILNAHGKTVINLGRGNPDQATFPAILETFKQAADQVSNQGYPPYGGKESLKQAIIQFYQDEYHVSLEKDEVTVFSGSLSALTALPMVLVNPKEIVLTPNPAFFGYDAGIKMAEGIAYPLPLLAENHFLPQYDDIPKEILEKAKLLFLNYPNNPTGAGATKEFFDETVTFARENNIVVAHDFAYSDISFKGKSPSFLQSSGAKEVGIEIYTLSKTFNMAGFRLAFAVGNKEVISLLKGYIRASVGGSFGASQDAAVYGLLHSQKERDNLRRIYKERKALAYDLLTNAGLEVVDAAGTFFLWVKLPQAIKNEAAFVNDLLQEKQVAVIPGSTFGSSGKGYIRLSLVSDKTEIREGIKKIIAFIRDKEL
ncbi:aminotransferase class I/II-fold pyridoxal phosphate-dependent enzyme [Streptococcus dentiloxodontae]